MSNFVRKMIQHIQVIIPVCCVFYTCGKADNFGEHLSIKWRSIHLPSKQKINLFNNMRTTSAILLYIVYIHCTYVVYYKIV